MFGRKIFKAAVSFLAFLSQTCISSAASEQNFRSDEWITECDAGRGIDTPECSITVRFWQTQGDQKGSFALVVMLQTGNLGIVGDPFPHQGGAPGRQKRTRRVPTSALLHLSERSSAPRPQATKGWVPRSDRRVHREGCIQF
jgi:hypothetical protein